MTKDEYRLALAKAVRWIADGKSGNNSCVGCALSPFRSFSGNGRCKACAQRVLWLVGKELELDGKAEE